MSTDLSSAEKILVRVPNWVGDAVLSLPALHALQSRFPAAETVVLARPWVAQLYRPHQAAAALASRVLEFDHHGRHRGLAGLRRLAAELRRERFDLAILFQNAFQAALLAAWAGIGRRVGYRRDGRGWLLTQPIAVPRPGEIARHETFYYLELLRRAGLLETLPGVEHIPLTADPQLVGVIEGRLRVLGISDGELRVVVAPGAAYGSAKCWLPERYAALADRLVEKFGAAILLCGTSAEADLAARIAAAMRASPACGGASAVSLVGETSLGEYLALLATADLFIGNDSGAMHLAAGVGLAQVILFGPTDEAGTGPVNPRARVVKHPVSCSPCFLRHCPVDHRCMTSITVEDAWQAVEAVLASSRSAEKNSDAH